MEKKYVFTGETLEWNGHTLHRIQATKDFGSVKKGDLGGWIESEKISLMKEIVGWRMKLRYIKML